MLKNIGNLSKLLRTFLKYSPCGDCGASVFRFAALECFNAIDVVAAASPHSCHEVARFAASAPSDVVEGSLDVLVVAVSVAA